MNNIEQSPFFRINYLSWILCHCALILQVAHGLLICASRKISSFGATMATLQDESWMFQAAFPWRFSMDIYRWWRFSMDFWTAFLRALNSWRVFVRENRRHHKDLMAIATKFVTNTSIFQGRVFENDVVALLELQ